MEHNVKYGRIWLEIFGIVRSGTWTVLSVFVSMVKVDIINIGSWL